MDAGLTGFSGFAAVTSFETRGFLDVASQVSKASPVFQILTRGLKILDSNLGKSQSRQLHLAPRSRDLVDNNDNNEDKD